MLYEVDFIPPLRKYGDASKLKERLLAMQMHALE